MSEITLTQLQAELSKCLARRAADNHHSIEAEIIAILESVLLPEIEQTSPVDLATAIQQRFADVEDLEIAEIPRDAIRETPLFD